MSEITLTINGKRVNALVEPRTHLADFLREQRRLTGTHLGCEHGVCGACTVLLDGKPIRSCITFAVACEGGEVRTIESFENDDLMNRLREAFSREHGLQCGFCTPGMLITARDICLRKPGASEEKVRSRALRKFMPLYWLCGHRQRSKTSSRRAIRQGRSRNTIVRRAQDRSPDSRLCSRGATSHR